MKKEFTLTFCALIATTMVWDANFHHANGSSGSAPSGNTGSPADGGTCAHIGCHAGGPAQTDQAVSLTGNIPVEGYIPGQTYDMTITMSNGGTKFGFSLSPQSAQGALLGTLIASGAGTTLNGAGGKYLTHTSLGNTGSGTKSWTFEWTAPAAGTGSVTFYSAHNFANNNGDNSGDVIVAYTRSFDENVAIGVAEPVSRQLEVFPNPVEDHINIRIADVDEVIMVTLMSTDGHVLVQEAHTQGNIRIDLQGHNVPSGMYLLAIEQGGQRTVRKVMVR
ncbi:MAG: T9SS type A sorting domain-containing protein [Flavobacteriales bacterium]|nr:T9SS type A sorting domain-containing protein [Flavobacteriales bacterium]